MYKENAPVKVFNHAFQLLQFLNTEFVLLQQPDCAWAKKSFRQEKLSLFEILTFFHFFEFSYWILFSHLAGSLLVSKAL